MQENRPSSRQLSVEEMHAFTDARLHSKQKEVLRNNRIPFALSAKGRPVTTWDAINRALSGSRNASTTAPTGFDLSGAR